MDSPAAMLIDLHGRLLRAMAERGGRHFQGLQQAVRHHRSSLTGRQQKRLLHVEVAYNMLRHVRRPLVNDFYEEVMEGLRIEEGKGEENTVTAEKLPQKAEYPEEEAVGAGARAAAEQPQGRTPDGPLAPWRRRGQEGAPQGPATRGRAGRSEVGAGRGEGRASDRSAGEEEEVEDLPTALKVADPLLHAKVRRQVEGACCVARVVNVERGRDTKELLYLIKYADGDVEHLTASQVRDALVDRSSSRGSKWSRRAEDEQALVAPPRCTPLRAGVAAAGGAKASKS